jgi:WD40 repeat protein
MGILSDNKTLICACNGLHSIQFREVRTGKLMREISLGELHAQAFALSANKKVAAVGGVVTQYPFSTKWSHEIHIYETESRKEVRTIKHNDLFLGRGSLLLSPDGKLLISIDRMGLFRIEEISTGDELLTHVFPGGGGSDMALSADGSTLALSTGPNSRKLFVWNWKTANEPREIKVRDRVGRSLAFSPDGKHLAETGEIDEELRIWDVATGRLLHQLDPPQTRQYYFGQTAYSPDGKTLAVSFRDGQSGGIDLYDASSAHHRRRLQTKNDSVGQVTFSPDSKLLVGSSGGISCLGSSDQPAIGSGHYGSQL